MACSGSPFHDSIQTMTKFLYLVMIHPNQYLFQEVTMVRISLCLIKILEMFIDVRLEKQAK